MKYLLLLLVHSWCTVIAANSIDWGSPYHVDDSFYPPFHVPSVPYSFLKEGSRRNGWGRQGIVSTSFSETLREHGIVAITDIPMMKELHIGAMESLENCALEHSQLFAREALQDGTLRLTLASETRSGVSMPFEHQIQSKCSRFAAISSRLRKLTTEVSKDFIKSLDTAFNGLQIERGPGDNNSFYGDLGHALEHAQQLDHFHTYKAPSVAERAQEIRSSTANDHSIDFHTDDGLFIAISPALLATTSSSSSSSSSFTPRREKPHDDKIFDASPGFFIELRNTSKVEALFPSPHCLVFMMGAGMARWVKLEESSRDHHHHHRDDHDDDTTIRSSVPHAVRVPSGATRLWYGRMFLPPPDAYSTEAGVTFQAYRSMQLMLQSSSPSSSSSPPSSSLSALGCARVYQDDDEQTRVAVAASRENGTRSSSSSSSRYTIHKEEVGCAAGEFHCWMKCWAADDPQCSASQHKECLSTSTGEPCDPGKMGCLPKCLANNATAGGTGDNGKFCNRENAVSMFMEGFQNPTSSKQACVILLFPNWVLDTKAKYIWACFGVIGMGVLLEVIIALRRFLRTQQQKKVSAARIIDEKRGAGEEDHEGGKCFDGMLKGVGGIIEAITYAIQTCLGYLLMLVAMTFSSPLFASVVIGLAIGHVIFNRHSPVSEGATPCCEGTSLQASDSQTNKISLLPTGSIANYGSELKEGSAIFDENGSNMASNIKNEGGCCSSANPNVYQRLPESS